MLSNIQSQALLFYKNIIFSIINIQQTLFYTLLTSLLTYFLTQYLHELFKQVTKYKILLYLMLLMANPYIYRLILADPLDSIQLSCLVLFVLVILSKQYRESPWSFIAIGIATGLNPSHGLIAIQGLIITKCNLKQKLLLYLSSVILSAMMLSFFIGSELIYYYRQIYFPQVFTPQFNLTWILYSHMFERYLFLYQLAIIVIPVYTLYLVNHIQIPSELQIVTLLYFSVFCHFKCSELCLVFTMFLQVLIMLKLVPKLIRKWQKICKDSQIIKIKIMNLLIVIVEVSFFFLTKIFLERYLNDFTMQMGFLLVYRTIFWCCRSIYLSETIISVTTLEKELAKSIQHSSNSPVDQQPNLPSKS